MPEIPTIRADVREMKGVHLFHFAASNCSQRVRMALTEKAIPWESHHVDLTRNEHVTPEFQALNPKGVVPVLVHDGKTINESNDIVTYIDATFAGPRLMPASEQDQAFVRDAIRTTDAIQPALKLLSHEFLFKPVRRMNDGQLADFERRCTDRALVQFMKDLSSRAGFGTERIAASVKAFTDAFRKLESRLAAATWLSGDTFGIADISWIVNVHRVATARYPLVRFPRLDDWYRRMTGRPSYELAIRRYEDRRAALFFALYTRWRSLRGSAIVTYL